MNWTFRAVVVTAAVCAAGTSFAGVNEWTPVGPPGASVSALRYLPGPNRVAIVVTRHAIYRSTDDGGTWSIVQRLAAAGDTGRPCMLAVNPADGNQVLVASGTLYRSADQGLTWTATTVGGLTGAQVQARCVAFANSGGIAWVGGPQGRVHRSPDGGATWELRNTGIPSSPSSTAVAQIEVDASDAGVAYVRVEDSVNFYRTQNGGVNWTAVAFPAPFSTTEMSASRTTAGVLLRAPELYSLSIDRTSNYGDNWSAVAGQPLTTMRFSPTTTGRVLAYDPTNIELEISDDEGVNWTTRAPLPVYWPKDIAIDPTTDDRLLIGSSAGVRLSTNRGLSWVQRNTGLAEATVSDIVTRGNLAFAVAVDEPGIYKYDIASGSWLPIAGSPTPVVGPPDGIGGLLTIASVDGQRLIFSRAGRVAHSLDGGATWTQIATLPNLATSMTWDPTSEVTGYAVINSSLYKTADGGTTWDLLGNTPSDLFFVAVDPSNPAHLIISGAPGNGGAVFNSLDGGLSWTVAGLTTSEATGLPVFKPGRPTDVYVPANADGIFVSTNGGNTWTRLTSLPAGFSANRVIIDDNATDVMYAVDARDFSGPTPRVIRSVDAGASWHSLSFQDAFGNTSAWDIGLLPQGRGDVVVSQRDAGLNQIRIAPDLRVTATGNMTAAVSGSVVLTVTNLGAFTASAVQISAELPVASGTYTVAGTGTTCAVTGRQLECMATALAPLGVLSASVAFAPSVAGAWQASVQARELDSVTSNNSTTLTVAAASANPPSGTGGGGGGRLDCLLLVLLGALSLGKHSFRDRCRTNGSGSFS